MEELFSTPCPECNSPVQTSPQQWEATGGVVRCAVCSYVFSADHPLGDGIISHDSTEAPSNSDLVQALALIPEEALKLKSPLRKRHPWATGARLLLCTAAMLTLGAQYLWFERNTLSYDPVFKNLYQHLCVRLDCELPPRLATELIRSHQLIVRNHAVYANALSIDLLISNEADFEQPFPAIALTFSDRLNKPLAGRIFQPREYLGGDLIQRPFMPKNQPVQLKLEIITPSPEARNYQIHFLPRQ
jgi:hypothetical protein